MAGKKTKKKRKSNKGKSKGSSFERDGCKRLSLWWTSGASDQVFWRNSGFLARGPGCKEHQYGDLHAIDAEGSWFAKNVNVEFKFYKDLRILEIVDKPSKKHVLLLRHWEQCVGDAEASDREPMLVAKRNFAEPFVVCHSDLAQHLVEAGDMIEFYACGTYLSLFALDKLEEFCPSSKSFMDALGGTRVDREKGKAKNVQA